MIPVPDIELSPFGGPLDHMPKIEDIPEKFKRNNSNNKWIKAQQDWFFKGIKKTQLIPKKGVDRDKAIRALSAIQRSWEPSHEHKEAAVAYLMSEWFDDYVEEER